MIELRSVTGCFIRRTTLAALGLGLVAGPLSSGPALARHHHHAYHAHRARVAIGPRVFGLPRPAHRSGGYIPPFSEYAVDGNSGRVLYAQDENALRHPASITKVMTLYLLFGELERGSISLDTRIEVSSHAAAQKPTKLGLRPGSTIRVEDAIKAIVTKSANDMAVAIAERLGGSEPAFARMMTRKAHALGMSRTNFVNASGLPADEQLTTARDLATLGRAIHDHFPRYFRYFSTPSFTYAGQFMPNHNHLMEQVEGMDGIKTGYTNASGFNLLSSVNRDGHWLISVVLGGKTRLGRDRIMADLIATQIDKCATHRTTPMVAENPELEHVAEAIPVVSHVGEEAPPIQGVDDEAAEGAPAVTESREAEAEPAPPPRAEAYAESNAEAEPEAPPPPRPARVRRAAPVEVAVETPPETPPETVRVRPRPAFVANIPVPPERDIMATGSIRQRQAARLDGSTARYDGTATTTPTRHGRHEKGDAGERIKLASLESDAPLPTGRPAMARDGWMIQIGATDDMAKANALIARAKAESHGALAKAHPFTEKTQKGGTTLYRARFAGLDGDAAQSACRNLKHAGLSCFATKN